MNNLKNKSLLFFYCCFTLIWLLAALGFIGYGFGFFDGYDVGGFLQSKMGIFLFYGMGSLSAIVGFYFLRSFIVLYRRNRSFVQESELGNIQISSYAVRDLVHEILKNELELPSFKTTLTQSSDGIHISIKAKVESKADIGELGENVQNVLREEIHARTGLTVGRVDFYTQGVESKQIETPETADEEDFAAENDSEKVHLEGDNDEN